MLTRQFNPVLALLLVVGLTFGLVGQAMAQPPEKVRVLIGFERSLSPEEEDDIEDDVEFAGGSIIHRYRIVDAFAAHLPRRAVAKIRGRHGVRYVEEDTVVRAVGQTLPWGVDRIDADLVHAQNKGTGVNVAIIDTGIDKDHPDLAANIAGGRNFVGWWRVNPDKWDDDNGHGTHVAGIVAALDNDMGVIGVAPESSLYAVKVLNRNGSGHWTWVVAGIDWAVAGPDGIQGTDDDADVISMSLGGGYSQTVETACMNAYKAGIVIVAAAGNDGGPVIYPAALDSVIAVSATDDSDAIASWSNHGSEVELAAPGVANYSTYRGGRYKYLSGTSMSTPHVSGVAALVVASGTVSDEEPGYGIANDVRKRIKDTAEELGTSGWDEYYGYGLVDAEAAAAAIVDTEAPVITSGAQDLDATTGDAVNIWVTATDNIDPTSAKVFIDGDTVGQSMTETEGATTTNPDTFSYIYIAPPNSTATHTYYVEVWDAPANSARWPASGAYSISVTDNDAPEISNATGDTTAGTADETVATSATVTDNIDVVAATVHYIPIGGTETSASMMEGASNVWTADVPVGSQEGTITYYITAQDAVPNIARDPATGAYSIVVSAPDTEAPSITCLTGNTAATTGEAVTMEATITDNVGVVSATVHYTPIDGVETTVAMQSTPTAENPDLWSADVPVASDKVGTITYFITAQDAVPNAARDPATGTYTISVSDNEAPVISGATGDRTATTGEDVTVSATITDNIEVVAAMVHYTPVGATGESTAPMTKDAASYVWSATISVGSEEGAITYYITAQDAVPNTARDPAAGTYSIVVSAPKTEQTIHADVVVTISERWRGWLKYATATVSIVDAETGDAIEVADIMVYGEWSGSVSATDSGPTDSTGVVSFNSNYVWAHNSVTFTFMVTNVVPPEGSNLVWDGVNSSDTAP